MRAIGHAAKLISIPVETFNALCKDAMRWRAGKSLGFPQFCGHDASQPSGTSWYVELKQENEAYPSADEAMDAAMNGVIDRAQESK